VSPELLFEQALNGLSFGALLFILAAGLSLVFGMMDVVNLAHGAFYMLGAYVALSVVQRTGSFWLALVVAPLALGILGVILEPLLLRRLRGRHLDQVLLTIGVSLVIVDQIGAIWGREVRSLAAPAGLDGSVPLVGGEYPVYRLFVIGFGVLLAAVVSVVHQRTKVGMLIRAGVEDAEMLGALGVNTDRLFAATFAVGAALAGLPRRCSAFSRAWTAMRSSTRSSSWSSAASARSAGRSPAARSSDQPTRSARCCSRSSPSR